LHAVKNGLDSFRGGAGNIGVFNAQYEGATMAAGIGPGEECGAGAAYVQVTGGAGGKTSANWLHGLDFVWDEGCILSELGLTALARYV
jgi:hypothetical protein